MDAINTVRLIRKIIDKGCCTGVSWALTDVWKLFYMIIIINDDDNHSKSNFGLRSCQCAVFFPCLFSFCIKNTWCFKYFLFFFPLFILNVLPPWCILMHVPETHWLCFFCLQWLITWGMHFPNWSVGWQFWRSLLRPSPQLTHLQFLTQMWDHFFDFISHNL